MPHYTIQNIFFNSKSKLQQFELFQPKTRRRKYAERNCRISKFRDRNLI